MEVTHVGHTNIHWYPCLDLGSYFRLQNGTLLQRPMYRDGQMADSGDTEVDWHRGTSEEDLPRLRAIVQELAGKI